MSQTTVGDNQTHELPAGSLADFFNPDLVSAVNEEASTEIPFGRAVIRGTDETMIKILAGASLTAIAGILTLLHGVPGQTVGDDGLLADAMGRVLRKGRIWVFSETGNAPADAVRVRHTVDTGKFVGNFTKTADANKTFLLTGAEWAKTTTAAGLTVLEFDVMHLTVTTDT